MSCVPTLETEVLNYLRLRLSRCYSLRKSIRAERLSPSGYWLRLSSWIESPRWDSWGLSWIQSLLVSSILNRSLRKEGRSLISCPPLPQCSGDLIHSCYLRYTVRFLEAPLSMVLKHLSCIITRLCFYSWKDFNIKLWELHWVTDSRILSMLY